jgi:hypothetical protein
MCTTGAISVYHFLGRLRRPGALLPVTSRYFPLLPRPAERRLLLLTHLYRYKCVIIIGVVSAYIWYKCAYYCDTRYIIRRHPPPAHCQFAAILRAGTASPRPELRAPRARGRYPCTSVLHVYEYVCHCHRIIGVVSVYMQYNCVYYYDTCVCASCVQRGARRAAPCMYHIYRRC